MEPRGLTHLKEKQATEKSASATASTVALTLHNSDPKRDDQSHTPGELCDPIAR